MAKQHAHKYRRHRYSTGREVYFCALPDCIVKSIPALTLGKRAVCWRCGEEFIMNEYSIRLAKPHCEKCHQAKVGTEVRVQIPVPEITEISDSTTSLRDRMNSLFKKEPVADGEEDI